MKYMHQGYSRPQAEQMAKQSLGIAQTIPSQGSSEIYNPLDQPTQAKPFQGQYANVDQQLASKLSQHGIDFQEFNNAKSFYAKKGIQKSDDQIIGDLGQAKQFQKQQQAQQAQQQTAQHFSKIKTGPMRPQVASPEQLQQPRQKVDPRSRLASLRIKREALTKMKQMNLNESQVRVIAKQAMLLAEKKKYAKMVLREALMEQKHSKRLIENLLMEGPLSNVWGGIKSAIGGAASAWGGAKDVARDSGAQKAQTEMIKAVKQAQSLRQKFNNQILKNAEIINQYHDAVVNALAMYQQIGGGLGPAAQKVGEEVNQLIGNLYRDLDSEKEGIDNYLKSLSQTAPESKKMADTISKVAGEGPEMGSGATEVAHDPAHVGLASQKGKQFYKNQGAPALRPRAEGEEMRSGEMADRFEREKFEFENVMRQKYGDQIVYTMDPALLGKAFAKFMKQKYGQEVPEQGLYKYDVKGAKDTFPREFTKVPAGKKKRGVYKDEKTKQAARKASQKARQKKSK